MDLFFRSIFPSCSCKAYRFYLACSFLTGLISGTFVSVSADDSFISLMRTADFSCVSIVSLLVIITLPFLFSALAVYICQNWLLIPIAFFKAFFFSFLFIGIYRAFGSAGWLVRFLLMFSDSVLLPVLWWFWLKITSERNRLILPSVFISAIAAIVIGSFDFLVVSPFAIKLIS